jgi:ABC-type Fe3+/spermidine/putrescine transport system ATPase subunit
VEPWKTFGVSTAVRDFSIEVKHGEFLSLLGPSGCGKTTLLRIIAGLIEPDSGRVLIGGEDVTWKPVHQRNVGLVFQSYALFPHMSVFENIAFGPRRRDMSEKKIRERVEEMLAMVRLKGLGGRYPSELSGGQQQRVALADSRDGAFHFAPG